MMMKQHMIYVYVCHNCYECEYNSELSFSFMDKINDIGRQFEPISSQKPDKTKKRHKKYLDLEENNNFKL